MAFKIPNFYSTSPLHGSYYNPKGETYISEVGMIQQAANAIATAGLNIDNESAESKANRQEKRVEKRNKRGKDFTGEKKDKFDKKTEKIKDKASKNRTTSSEEKEAQRKRDYDTMTDAEYKKKYGVDKPSTNSNTTSNIFK